MPLDPRLPVIVGVGQHQRKPAGSVAGLPSALGMVAEAASLAGVDSGTGDQLLRRADSVQVVDPMSWRTTNPAGALAQELGASPRETVATRTGGNTPQTLVNEASLAIQRGDLDVVVIAGVEVMYTRNLARKTGERPSWWDSDDDPTPPTRVVGQDRPGTSPYEESRGLTMPTNVYPILETALRSAKGESVAEHTARIAQLWSRFSWVAADNPHAWSKAPMDPADIAAPSPANRMVGFPYTKFLNANIQVDQAAALILCSVEAARTAGVPEDRWVFPWAGADAHDHWFVSNRESLAASPAIAACGRAVFDLTGRNVDDVAYIDLYSCFPAAVQLGADALGIDAWDPARVPTVTGGLTFGGGPGNNYVTHSIATMVERLRADEGASGLVTALGWYATKHAVGLYSTTPPEAFRWQSVQDEVDRLPARSVAEDHHGPATIESYTVVHDREGNAASGTAALLTDTGGRTWSSTTDPAVMAAMTTDDLAGRTAEVQGATFSVA